jgi:hypothetical protein
MSRSVDLFIDAKVSLDEVAEALGRLAGAPLVPEPEQARWQLRLGETHAILAEHPYGDDGKLLFTRYRFALSVRVANEVRIRDTPEAAVLRRVAQLIQQGPAWPVLLVHDLQYSELVGAGGAGEAGEPDGSAAWPDPAPAVIGATGSNAAALVTGAPGPHAADAGRTDSSPGAAG